MEKLQTVQESRDILLSMYPREINIFISRQHGINSQTTPYSYRFVFSHDGRIRNLNCSKKELETSYQIYQKIEQEFFVGNKLLSLTYNTEHIVINYYGFILENNQDEKLNIYVAENIPEVYLEIESQLLRKKEEDLPLYLEENIKNGALKRLIITPSYKKSGIYYMQDETFNWPFNKERKLGYFYKKEEQKIFYRQKDIKYAKKRKIETISNNDLAIILSAIYSFINLNLEHHPMYQYTYTKYKNNMVDENNRNNKQEYKTQALYIFLDNGKYIQITDEDLIYKIEKAGVIDDLKAMEEQNMTEEEKYNSLERTLKINRDK